MSRSDGLKRRGPGRTHKKWWFVQYPEGGMDVGWSSLNRALEDVADYYAALRYLEGEAA